MCFPSKNPWRLPLPCKHAELDIWQTGERAWLKSQVHAWPEGLLCKGTWRLTLACSPAQQNASQALWPVCLQSVLRLHQRRDEWFETQWPLLANRNLLCGWTVAALTYLSQNARYHRVIPNVHLCWGICFVAGS